MLFFSFMLETEELWHGLGDVESCTISMHTSIYLSISSFHYMDTAQTKNYFWKIFTVHRKLMVIW